MNCSQLEQFFESLVVTRALKKSFPFLNDLFLSIFVFYYYFIYYYFIVPFSHIHSLL